MTRSLAKPAVDSAAPTDTSRYGKFYWCIQTPDGGSIHVHGDSARIEGGSLIVWHDKEDGTGWPNLVLAPGQWTLLYAASVLDGGAVAVDHWNVGGRQGRAPAPTAVKFCRRAGCREDTSANERCGYCAIHCDRDHCLDHADYDPLNPPGGKH